MQIDNMHFVFTLTAPSGRYTPLKLINGKKEKFLAKDEDLDEKEINAPDE
jgi:hypothetical protein